MQPQDVTENVLFKLWPWIEANLKPLIYGTAIALVIVCTVSFYSWRRDQREVVAGEALTKVLISNYGNSSAEGLLKVAADYPGTRAGQRAWLQGASALFASAKYADAQAQFQKYVNNYPDNDFSSEAMLGIGACLDAQGQLDAAAGQYQKAINTSSDPGVVLNARFALGMIDERQGKISEAQKLYQDIIRTAPQSLEATEASLRLIGLQSTVRASTPAATTHSLIDLLNH